VADPAGRTRVFRWNLTETTDPLGNRVEYEYERDTGTDGSRRWDQTYLRRIRYVDYDDGGATRFLVSVTFVHEDRPDPFSDHRAGFEVRTRRRVRRIEIRTHADADVLARTVELDYVDHLVATGERPATDLPRNGLSMLARVTVVGHDGNRTQELAPLDLTYTAFSPERRQFRPIDAPGGALPPVSLADAGLETVDLVGDGLPDLVQMDGSARFWRNHGGGRYVRPEELPGLPSGIDLDDPGVQLADMDGDGRADLLSLSLGGYFRLGTGARGSGAGFVPYPAAPAVSFGADDIRLVDLDGDGVVDALRTATELELFFNDPERGWDRIETRRRRPLAEFPDVDFADPRVKLADLDGDGLQDIVLVDQGRIDYWPYQGHGRWGRRVTMAASPRFRDDPPLPEGFDPRRVLMGDLDGDGVADLVYVQADRVTVWINQGGERWSAPFDVEGTPPFTDIDGVRLIDLLGIGTCGVLWTSDPVPGTGSHYRFLDLTGGVKPYLLATTDNNMGAVTTVSYASSTGFYLDDDADPSTRWRTKLPFPTQVVARVEVVDEVSNGRLTREYHYRDGYWDGVEREFRGFGLVEQRDTETFERDGPGRDERRFSPPVLTRTWFHLGAVGDATDDPHEPDRVADGWPEDPPVLGHREGVEAFLATLPDRRARRDAVRALRGSVLRTELYSVDSSTLEARPHVVTERAFGLRQESVPGGPRAGRRRVFFPHLTAERTSRWERGTEPMTTFEFVDDHDAHGQPRRIVRLAVPRGRDPLRRRAAGGEPYLATMTLTRFATGDDSRLLVDRVAARTTHEVRNDGRPSVFELRDAARTDAGRLPVIEQALSYYDGEPFTGLPLGRIGAFGLVTRSESLVLSEEIARAAYGDGLPPFLDPTGAPAWTADHPEAVRAATPPVAGHRFSPGGDGAARGWFVQEARHRYDVHAGRSAGRGLVVATRDRMGRDTVVDHDRFGLLPVRSTDPVGLTTSARNDYRVLQPDLGTDANGNRTAFRFTPLGLVESIAVLGRQGEAVGDTAAAPGTRFVYELRATPGTATAPPRPVSVRTVRRVHHARGPGVPPSERDGTAETVECSDGFGRLVQTRTVAEDVTFGDPVRGAGVVPAGQDDRATQDDVTGRPAPVARPGVVVSGWQVYDNKGRVVEKLEPFFADGLAFAPPTAAQEGRRLSVRHDPLGRVVHTLNPDGSEERVLYGVPADVGDPGSFRPTPWESYWYDANDLADRDGHEHHHATPSSVVLDALGRTVVTVERTRAPRPSPDAPLPPATEVVTRTGHDIRGNPVSVTDGLGREAFRSVHDLAGHELRRVGIDAGTRQVVLDAVGRPVEQRDAKGALVLTTYDALGRVSGRWARDDGSSAVTRRERLDHGDGGDPRQPAGERAAARAANRLGRLHRHHDEAGLLTVDAYDFKGNVVEQTRRVIADDVVLAAAGAFTVDWEPPAGGSSADLDRRLLDPAPSVTSTTYDALDRPVTVTMPAGTDGARRRLRYGYDRAGGLERVALDGTDVVERIVRDAGGRRTLVALGNGVMTRYAHDPSTTRLVRIRSERFTKPTGGRPTYRPTGPAIQDLAFRYDAGGNVLDLVDRTPGAGVRANPDAGLEADPALRASVARGDALVRRFTYDALSRLVSATGRTCTVAGPTAPWESRPGCGFDGRNHGLPDQDNAPALASVYRERYEYDAVGNLVRSHRSTAGSGAVARRYGLVEGTNRLRQVEAAGARTDYAYDPNGNLTGEAGSRRFEWDHADRMKAFRTQAGSAEPSVQARYLYDAAGRRVKKVVRRQGGGHETVTYVGNGFEHHAWTGAGGDGGVNTLVHVMDGDRRVATVREGPAHPDDRGPATQYQLGDHLGSASVTVDDTASFLNREEYTPHGETTFGSFGRKRYRYGGMERDEESGLALHLHRYLAPWLGRWVSTDPLGPADGPNLYALARGNPLRFTDAGGTQSEDPQAPAPPAPDGAGPAAKVLRKLLKLHVTEDDTSKVREAMTFIFGLPDNPLDILSVGMNGGGMPSGEWMIGDKFLFAGSVVSLFTSDTPQDQVQAGLGVVEGSLGVASEAAGFAGSEALAARLAIGSSMAGFASAYMVIWTDMAESRLKALNGARDEGRITGTLLGFAVGATGGDAQWVRNELVLRNAPPFAAARVKQEAFNKALWEGFGAATGQLTPEQRRAYVNTVTAYAEKNGRRWTGFREDYTNLVWGLANTTVPALGLARKR
jgi:RHS repeat-associated protein